MPDITDEPESPGPSLCEDCGNALGAGARFCAQCGRPTVPLPPREPRWPHVASVLWIWVLLLAVSGVTGIAMHFAESDDPRYDLWAGAAFTVIVVVAALANHKGLGKLFIQPVSGWRLLETVLVAAGMIVFIRLYLAALAPLGIEDIRYTDSYVKHGYSMWWAALSIVVLPAIFEEIVFRGVIWAKLEKVGKPGEVLVIQACLFSVLHLLPAVFISHFVLGLGLGWLRKRSGSLIPGILAHAALNGMVLLEELVL